VVWKGGEGSASVQRTALITARNPGTWRGSGQNRSASPGEGPGQAPLPFPSLSTDRLPERQQPWREMFGKACWGRTVCSSGLFEWSGRVNWSDGLVRWA